MPILKTALTFVAAPALLGGGYVTVMGTTGACPTCAAIVASVTGTSGSEPAAVAASGEEMPASTVPAGHEAAPGVFGLPLMDLDGNLVDLADHAGKPMLIEVWATWCGPCRKVRSIIKQHEAELSEVATLVGVSVDQGGPQVVKNYLSKTDGPDMLEFMATPQFRSAIEPFKSQNTIPQLVYVGPDGNVATLSHGVNSPTFMLGLLRNLGGPTEG